MEFACSLIALIIKTAAGAIITPEESTQWLSHCCRLANTPLLSRAIKPFVKTEFVEALEQVDFSASFFEKSLK